MFPSKLSSLRTPIPPPLLTSHPPHLTTHTLHPSSPHSSSPHGLKHQTQVVLVEEVPKEPHAMELIIRISIVELLEDAQLLQTCLVHHLVVPDNLDGHLLVGFEGVPRTHHVTEHPVTCVPIHRVTSVQLLTNTHTCQHKVT